MGIQRCGDADGNEIDLGDTTEVGCGLKHSLLHQHRKITIDDIADIVVTCVNLINLGLLYVEANGLESGLGFLDCKGQAYIAKPHYAGYYLAVGNFL